MRFKSERSFVGMLVAGALMVPAAHAGGATGGATEPTQILNKVLLTKQLSEQSAMVAQEVLTATNTLNTYNTMLKDMMALPAAIKDKMLSPFESELAAYYKAYKAVDELNKSSEAAYDLYLTRAKDMQEMAEKGFDPKHYLAREAELAARNADAKKRLDEDMAKLKLYEDRMTDLQKAAADIPGIESSIGGFQALAALTSRSVAEQIETNKLLQQQIAERRVGDVQAAKDEAKQAEAEKQRIQKAQDAFNALKQPVSKKYTYDLTAPKL